MADPTSIVAALTALKNATDIVKVLRDVDRAYSQAELKNRIIELSEQVTAARSALLDAKEEIVARDAEIGRLKNALKKTGDTVKSGDAYFLKDEEGKPRDDPFCLRCWEVEHYLRHLVRNAGGSQFRCPACGGLYNWADIGWPKKK